MDLLAGLKIVVIAYLLALAAAAALGGHRALLGYPLYLGSFLLYVVSFGRLRLAPRARNFGSRQRRRLRSAWRDWRERRALERGEELKQRMIWHSVGEDADPARRDDIRGYDSPLAEADPENERQQPTLADYLER